MTVAPAFRASSAMRRELASMLESSMTPLTASCRAPPSLVKSFWYSIRTTAVFAGSTSMVASRGWSGRSIYSADTGPGGRRTDLRVTWPVRVDLRGRSRSRVGVGHGLLHEADFHRRKPASGLRRCDGYVVTVTVTVGPGTVIVTGGPNTVVVGPVTLRMTVVTVVTVLLIVVVFVCVWVSVVEIVTGTLTVRFTSTATVFPLSTVLAGS